VGHRWLWMASAGVVVLFIAACGASETVDTTLSPPSTTTSTEALTTTAPPTTTTAPPSSVTTAAETRIFPVPRGDAPTIDGVLEADEWADAMVTPVDDELSVLWIHTDGSLYLGVRHARLGAVNLVVAQDGRVRVLHSSAALGSAFYDLQDDGTWMMEHGFEWCCRVPSDEAGRAALSASEGWTATIGGAGVAGEIEFQVEIEPGDVWVAVTWVGSATEVVVWPGGLPVEEQETLYGTRTGPEAFHPETWMLVVLVG